MPYIFDEVCARQHLVASLHHVLEQLKFARPQINQPVATLRGAIDESELQVIPRAAPFHAVRPASEQKIPFFDILSTIDKGCFERPLY
jgi:hypothetical protein